MRRALSVILFVCPVLLSAPLAAQVDLAVPSAIPSVVEEGEELTLSVSGAQFSQVPVAVVTFAAKDSRSETYARDITRVIRNNLERVGLVRVLSSEYYPQSAMQIKSSADYPAWRDLGAQILVTGLVELTRSGRLRVEFYMLDVSIGKELSALAYSTIPSNQSRVAHVISDAIYERLASEPGAFDTRIVYVAESGPKTQRRKQLAVMDQDGGNQRYLTSGKHAVFTPRFSPNTQEIAYLAYVEDRARIYLLNIETGQQEMLGEFDGQPSAPRYSPRGDAIVLSISARGNTDIFEINLSTRKMRRLTSHSEIDTSACYSPDNQWIAFNSSRSGSPQIYVMRADGSRVKRVSFGEGAYSTPVWSPSGEWIAFTRQNGERFNLGIMRPDGSEERILSTGYMIEGPSWSPNGRMLAYFKSEPKTETQNGSSKLYTLDLFTFQERLIPTGSDASDPAWSPTFKG